MRNHTFQISFSIICEIQGFDILEDQISSTVSATWLTAFSAVCLNNRDMYLSSLLYKEVFLSKVWQLESHQHLVWILDGIRANYSGSVVALTDICLKPLGESCATQSILQIKDAAQLALKEMPSAAQEALSQSEYKRGVSAWNFDVEDLKAQASLVQDDDGVGLKEENGNIGLYVDNKYASGSGSGASVWEFGLPTNNVNSKGSGDDPAESLHVKAEIVDTEIILPGIQEINDVGEKGGSSNGVNLSRLDKPVVQE